MSLKRELVAGVLWLLAATSAGAEPGAITAIAGDSQPSYAGDASSAINAALNPPAGVSRPPTLRVRKTSSSMSTPARPR